MKEHDWKHRLYTASALEFHPAPLPKTKTEQLRKYRVTNIYRAKANTKTKNERVFLPNQQLNE